MPGTGTGTDTSTGTLFGGPGIVRLLDGLGIVHLLDGSGIISGGGCGVSCVIALSFFFNETRG